MSDAMKLKETIALTAAYYNYSLRPEVLLMYFEDLSEYEPQLVINAYREYRKNPKNKNMPLPAQIIQILNPESSPESVAIEVASKIRDAISKFGWCNADAAKSYIGSLGWKVVERSGGWSYLCENHGVELSPLTFFAQSRDLTKSILENSKSGNFDSPIALPENKNKEISLSDIKNEQVNNLIDFMKNKNKLEGV